MLWVFRNQLLSQFDLGTLWWDTLREDEQPRDQVAGETYQELITPHVPERLDVAPLTAMNPTTPVSDQV